MKKQVMLSVKGTQSYMDQEPDAIELVTEGVLENVDGGWKLTYAETELTGMAGVTTTFVIEQDKITLNRTGKLNSQMVFQEGITHESLYQVEFGALMICVCANRVMADISHQGGMIDLVYTIDIEHTQAGVVDYHLDIRAK